MVKTTLTNLTLLFIFAKLARPIHIYTNLKLAALGNFNSANLFCPDCGVFYWSFSEIDYLATWSQRFDTGEKVNDAWKNNQIYVRAVRSF